MPNIITNLRDMVEEFVHSRINIHHLKVTNTTDPEGDINTPGETDTYTFWGDADETVNLGSFSVTHGTKESLSLLKDVYDKDNSGVVDNSERLGGKSLTVIETERDYAIDDAFGNVYAASSNYTNGKVTDLLDGVTTSLDTFNKLASAINNDSNYHTTVSNELDLKLDSTSYNAADVKSKYESNNDTNNFSDSYKSKLDGIESSADVTDAFNVAAAGAVMESDTTTANMQFVIDEDSMISNLSTKVPTQQSVKAYVDNRVASSVYFKGSYNAATNTPNLDSSPAGIKVGFMYVVDTAGTFFSTGVEAGDVVIAEIDNPTLESHWTVVNRNLDATSIKVQYESNANTNAYTDTEKTKLAGIESGATGDQTAVEIKSLYESNSNTNAYTDIEKTKLAGIESGATADQSASEIKNLYESNSNTNVFTDAEKSKLSSIVIAVTEW